MARTKHTAREPQCPVCFQHLGLVYLQCSKCSLRFHRDCINQESIVDFVCADCYESNEFLVQKIMDHRLVNRERQFLVQWLRDQPSWEPETNLSNCLLLLKEYIASKGLEPTSLSEPVTGLVGSPSNSNPTCNWISLHRIRFMIKRWSIIWARPNIDLPISIVGQDTIDNEVDQLALLKYANHCYVILFIRSSRDDTTIRLADGNNLFTTLSDARTEVTRKIQEAFGWLNHHLVPVSCTFGARADLCGAIAIMAALSLSAQYKSGVFENTLYVPKQIRRRIFRELNSRLDSHHARPFVPKAGARCPVCQRWFFTHKSLLVHLGRTHRD